MARRKRRSTFGSPPSEHREKAAISLARARRLYAGATRTDSCPNVINGLVETFEALAITRTHLRSIGSREGRSTGKLSQAEHALYKRAETALDGLERSGCVNSRPR